MRARHRRVLLHAAALYGASAVLCPPPALAQDAVAFAQQRFLRGQQLYNTGDYTGALAEFRASLELYASPNSRLYVARALRELGRLGEAAVQLEQAVREATERAAVDPRYEPTRDAARDEWRELAPRVGHLVVLAPGASAATVLRVEGRAVPRAAIGLSVPVTPGDVEVARIDAGTVTARRVVAVRAGEERTMDIAPEPSHASRVAPSRAAPSRAAPLVLRPAAAAAPGLGGAGVTAVVLLAVGGAAGVGAATTGALEAGDLATVMNRCGSGPCNFADDLAIVHRGMALQSATNVLLGAGIGLAAVGLALLIVDRVQGRQRPAVHALRDGGVLFF